MKPFSMRRILKDTSFFSEKKENKAYVKRRELQRSQY